MSSVIPNYHIAVLPVASTWWDDNMTEEPPLRQKVQKKDVVPASENDSAACSAGVVSSFGNDARGVPGGFRTCMYGQLTRDPSPGKGCIFFPPEAVFSERLSPSSDHLPD